MPARSEESVWTDCFTDQLFPLSGFTCCGSRNNFFSIWDEWAKDLFELELRSASSLEITSEKCFSPWIHLFCSLQVISEAVRTTLGPRGMDKLMVDNRGEERRIVTTYKKCCGGAGSFKTFGDYNVRSCVFQARPRFPTTAPPFWSSWTSSTLQPRRWWTLLAPRTPRWALCPPAE